MDRSQAVDCLELNDDEIFDQEIKAMLPDDLALVANGDHRLANEASTSKQELDTEGGLVR